MFPSLASTVPYGAARRLTPVIILLCAAPQGVLSVYYGKSLGAIKTFAHGFTGTVYAANDTSIVITGLNYDGKGPAAYFWAGFNVGLDNKADQLLDENGSDKVLKAYQNAVVRLTLGKKITDYKSLGIYCKQFGAAEVVLKDSETMMLKEFEYDATKCAGSAFFVAAPTDNPQPDKMTRLMYDNGKTTKLEGYSKKDVVVTLPEGHSWNEFKWFSVYCVDSKQSYADITIDTALAEKLPLQPSRLLSHPSTDKSPNSVRPGRHWYLREVWSNSNSAPTAKEHGKENSALPVRVAEPLHD
ncbi:hypothetical protein HPB50_008994 [Hyalomma asiaticum]|uniref:Uncharacterized protein n=1 Tax=Hyalomma asiaticum TaxID=266040 RepID=A0ACB7RXW8_HYAAI|nr:hypothetical protein HPB50_008994 [Hyalomma asiaticum]